MRHQTRLVLEIGCALGLVLAVLLTLLGSARQQAAAAVRDDTVRLHILANSDTWEDQLLKIEVRNAVLAALPPALSAATAAAGAAAALRRALPALRTAILRTLHRAHSTQTVRLALERTRFAARDYGRFALPGGAYTALRVELGAAKGRNWFCVLYPALCVAGATPDYPTPAENALVFGRYEIRSALLDAAVECGIIRTEPETDRRTAQSD